ncbi:bifunctional diaminohydroxyphosphoribosylaminopyrimidine deaminase/5-amino-6-(5-phosphoribosylamino)uracil reductase RibD [Thermodesulforhabdus norvegica]|uniref:Riboflavin biosynthesis protein RibD n=1 Tax=Thermodesulforhabdus norvegica TaxID=39841 RepID=A0A1I4RIY2_9BACT|nr:bifunctional diaminohydroxyphosphoribosylaminopyrimidine deaminase/5-amino-6-(5-phosphoribosylamino)uracil reductase RibD [Thermodesulforhabdus norvegica]SFM52211.1 diaminohydroxyphosphoribosylaminopyrimidine deaminase [Thermodesulforhabdus norvegica]
MVQDADELFMKEAIRLARKAQGKTGPNPCVGAVLVKNGKIVGRGYHKAAGTPHAEINAIKDAGGEAKGATLYVTLEPCNHFGKTPPCTHAIVNAGIGRVVIGMRDPNPVAGGGKEYLESRGIAVTSGICERDCRKLNQPFIKWVTTGKPYVIVKIALTLDGKIATRTGHSRWVTNSTSRFTVHRLRSEVDAVLVGIGTVLADGPRLTARLGRKSRQPVRVILDSHLRFPIESPTLSVEKGGPLWIYCGRSVDRNRKLELETRGVRVVQVQDQAAGVKLGEVLQDLGKHSLQSLLVEGGSGVFRSFFSENLVDEVWLFYATKLIGDDEAVPGIPGWRECFFMDDAVRLYDINVKIMSPKEENETTDVLIKGRLRKELY